jgi:hypothetical protein
MTRITPLQFKDAFLIAADSVDTQIVSFWDKRRDYTALMLDIVLPKIAAELGISVYNANYYYLDSIFYDERDSDHFGPTTTYAKYINIALEHEHDVTGTAVEMNKLQLFNAPLKVLITYAQTDQLRSFYLDRYVKIINEADIFTDFSTLRRTLVIFGSLLENVVTWHFYAYESSGFQSI